MSDGFYRAFEDKYRGIRAIIKPRLAVYLPIIEPLKEIYQPAQVIDLGCGRGEWLEVLSDEGGFNAHGVDIDAGMLAVCDEYQLQHSQQDALSYLKELDDESQVLVTGFHIVEHIPFAELQELVQQALRVLKPAGLLILETPNPENIAVGTASFYLDPTHRQPIPPQLLSFVAEHYGFLRTKSVRLQEAQHLIDSDAVTLLDVINGVSPDYAIIAQKSAAEELIAKFDSVFSREYGLTLETLASRFEQGMALKFSQLELKIQASEEKIQAAEAKTQAAEEKTQLAEEKAFTAETKVYKLLDSKTWRYTEPIRKGLHIFKKIFK